MVSVDPYVYLTMIILEKCCCCSVRSGCLVCGVLYLLGGLYTLVDAITNAVQQSEIEALYYINYINLFLSIFIVIFSGLMLYGVHKGEPNYLVPSIIFFPIDTLARLAFIPILGFTIGFLHPLCIILSITYLVGALLAFFIWLCVYSHHHQLKNPLLSLRECDRQLQEFLQPSTDDV